MKQLKVMLLVWVVALLAACGTTRTVPITGRKQSLMVSNQEIMSLSNKEYSQYMQSAKKSTNTANTEMVVRVGKKLATAVENYLRNNGMAAEVSEYSWEFNLVQDKSANAFCLPGGKIVVFEGLLPYTKNENGLAIVLGHEIAHAVGKHSAEQISKQIKQQYGTQLLSSVLNAATGTNVGSYAAVLAQQGDSEATEWLLNKYKNFVRSKARSYFLVGADHEDIVQEGMIGLFKAFRDFNPDKLASFRAFAEICVTRQIITAIKTATRQKHIPLNSYVSLNKPIYDEESDRTLLDVITERRATNPEELIIGQEDLSSINDRIGEVLSDLEWEVLTAYLEGKSYQEIAQELGRHVKSIDNALQRVKRKLEHLMDEEK